MIKYRVLLLVSMLGGLGGCALGEGHFWPLMRPQADHSVAKEKEERRYSVGSLLAYAGGVAQMPSLQRLEECKRLVGLNEREEGLGIRIRLALVLMTTSHCVDNDSRVALEMLEKAMTQVEDPQLKNFLAYQKTLASRAYQKDVQQRRLIARISKWKKINYLERQKRHSCTDELQETREKLEALKAIEKSLNHTEVQ